MRDRPPAACPGFPWSCLREATNSAAAHCAREPERPESQGGSCVRRGSKARNSGASESELRDKIWTRSHADASHQASTMLALAGNNGEQESATFGLQPRRTKEAAPSLRADGAGRNWLRGQDLNLRPSGYEGDFIHPAGRPRYSCFQSLRAVVWSRKSSEVNGRILESPPVWTRSGQSSQGCISDSCHRIVQYRQRSSVPTSGALRYDSSQ